jgi:hypothetical protein
LIIDLENSHIDHVSSEVLAFIAERYANRIEDFIAETIELPKGMTAECGIHGPSTGGPPVPESEVVYKIREGRRYPSRMVDRPTRPMRTVTVIGGKYKGKHILFTAYGGPYAPREPHDASLPKEQRAESEAFWSQHALSL